MNSKYMRRCFDALFPSIERMLSATKPYLRVSSVEIDAISSARCPSVRARSRTPARMHVCVCVRVAVWLSGCLFSLAHDLSLLSLSLTLSLSHSLSHRLAAFRFPLFTSAHPWALPKHTHAYAWTRRLPGCSSTSSTATSKGSNTTQTLVS